MDIGRKERARINHGVESKLNVNEGGHGGKNAHRVYYKHAGGLRSRVITER